MENRKVEYLRLHMWNLEQMYAVDSQYLVGL